MQKCRQVLLTWFNRALLGFAPPFRIETGPFADMDDLDGEEGEDQRYEEQPFENEAEDG